MGALLRSERTVAQSAGDEAIMQRRQYLIFTVGGETFAIEITSIKEIIEHMRPTDVPLMPGYMRGIINLRGSVVPVIDLSVRFGRAAAEVTRRTCFVIVEIRHNGERHNIGVVVDTVSAVMEIADADIEPAPSFGVKMRSEFITGMGKIGEHFVIILDIAKVLSVDELSMLAEIGTGEAPAQLGAAHGLASA